MLWSKGDKLKVQGSAGMQREQRSNEIKIKECNGDKKADVAKE